MHFVTAMVAIGGDTGQTSYRGPFNCISWPEINVIRFLHGDDAVSNVACLTSVPQTSRDERLRLELLYGKIVSTDIYPGYTPSMEMEAPGAEEAQAGTAWLNPLTGRAEVIGFVPSEDSDDNPTSVPAVPLRGKGRAQSIEA